MNGNTESPESIGKASASETASGFDTPFSTSGEKVSVANIKQLGNYDLGELIGRGGMGNVFRAVDRNLGRDVAVKIPRLDLIFMPGLEARFLREAQAAARLDHTNLVSILEVSTDGPVPFIATTWCDQGDLSAWMRANSKVPSPQDVAKFMSDVADAIHHCHECGVVHLDLKPSNILLVSRSNQPNSNQLTDLIPKVTDFGLARLLEGQMDQSSTSLFLGTPLYMAPEQAECKRELIGPSCDIFALGLILHELASGERRFSGETVATVLDEIRHINGASTLSIRQLPRDLRTIISCCLQHNPADRYRTAGELAEDLRSFANSRPIKAQPVSAARRFWLWCQRPERITQAGTVTVAIQVTVLTILYGHFVLIGLGYELPFELNNRDFFRETIPIALFPHIPLLINGFRTIRHRRWAVLIGTVLSTFFVAALFAILLGKQESFSMYKDNPMASYVAHLFLSCFAIVQFLVYLVAIPASRAR